MGNELERLAPSSIELSEFDFQQEVLGDEKEETDDVTEIPSDLNEGNTEKSVFFTIKMCCVELGPKMYKPSCSGDAFLSHNITCRHTRILEATHVHI